MISILAKGAPEEWKEREWEWDGQGGRKVMKGGIVQWRSIRSLVSALYSRFALVLIHRLAGCGTLALPCINVVHLDLLEIGVLGKLFEGRAWWQDAFEQWDRLRVNALGELHGDADEEVTGLVVPL